MNEQEKGGCAAGLAVCGSLVTRTAGLVASVISFMSENPVGAGLCLAACALIFGMTASASLRT